MRESLWMRLYNAIRRHRRSKPPRQSLRFMYRIELATLESDLVRGPPTVKVTSLTESRETLRPMTEGEFSTSHDYWRTP
jgi:hypothetical protein